MHQFTCTFQTTWQFLSCAKGKDFTAWADCHAGGQALEQEPAGQEQGEDSAVDRLRVRREEAAQVAVQQRARLQVRHVSLHCIICDNVAVMIPSWYPVKA